MRAEEVDVSVTASETDRLRRLWFRFGTHERLYPIICCLVTLLCVLIAYPFAATGFNDDWSYSQVALKYTETGHLRYNGWGPAMQLFQALWGAGWIRLFGFSFDLLRLVTLP